MKKRIYYIYALLLNVCCTCIFAQPTPVNEASKTDRGVVVVVLKAPMLPDTVNVAPRMSYIGGKIDINGWCNYEKINLAPQYNKIDTINVVTNKQALLVQHRYGYEHFAQILLQPGDELHIKYDKDIPIFLIVNRHNKQYDGKLHLLLDSLVHANEQFTALNMFDAYHFFTRVLTKNGLGKSALEKPAYGQLALHNLNREQQIIDSLFQLHQLSADMHLINTDRITFLSHIIRFKMNQYTQASAKNLIDSLRQVPEGKPYSYYTQFCDTYVNKFIVGKLPLIRGAGSVIVDYRRAYDSVKLFARPLHKAVQAQLLYKQLELIAQNFSSADLARYLADYRQTTGDTATANAMANAYLMDLEPLRKLADSVYLLGAAQQKTTLDAVLKANRGKVVFVDCWASWCLPCLEAMPYTKKLIDNYSDKGLTVLFLSFDRKKDDWQKANDKHGLRFYKNNFLVVNPAASAYLKKLKVSSLPRYLLFDKKGQLVNANAQDAKSKLTLTAIASLLKQ